MEGRAEGRQEQHQTSHQKSETRSHYLLHLQMRKLPTQFFCCSLCLPRYSSFSSSSFINSLQDLQTNESQKKKAVFSVQQDSFYEGNCQRIVSLHPFKNLVLYHHSIKHPPPSSFRDLVQSSKFFLLEWAQNRITMEEGKGKRRRGGDHHHDVGEGKKKRKKGSACNMGEGGKGKEKKRTEEEEPTEEEVEEFSAIIRRMKMAEEYFGWKKRKLTESGWRELLKTVGSAEDEGRERVENEEERVKGSRVLDLNKEPVEEIE